MSIRIFQGSLPLLMMFDLPDDVMIDDGCVQGLQEELDVSITIKPKSRQANKTVIIRTQERNGSAIYKVRRNALLSQQFLFQPCVSQKYNYPIGEGRHLGARRRAGGQGNHSRVLQHSGRLYSRHGNE